MAQQPLLCSYALQALPMEMGIYPLLSHTSPWCVFQTRCPVTACVQKVSINVPLLLTFKTYPHGSNSSFHRRCIYTQYTSPRTPRGLKHR